MNSDSQERVTRLVTVSTAHFAGREIEEDSLDQTLALFGQLYTCSPEEIQQAKQLLMDRLSVKMDAGVAVVAPAFRPWLQEAMAGTTLERWLAYKQMLSQEGLPTNVLRTMDKQTDRIVELLGDPRAIGNWQRRGLIIGDVQSGKTATYLGILNKAADLGYKLIIVLAGNTESLRRQTQLRVDEGFIGRDSRVTGARLTSAAKTSYVGIGTIDKSIATATGLTTQLRDFGKKNQQVLNLQVGASTVNPHILVVKKNKAVLNAVQDWLRSQAATGKSLDLPLLLLDDESDYASVNTSGEDDPTAINKAIRSILERSSRASYLAFTATPFANIFIDESVEDDLFPRDYIYALEAPSNYVGPESTFGGGSLSEPLDPVGAAATFPFGHKSQLQVDNLPESLHDATRSFLIACAIRDIRGDRGPRSMLVNVSRFVNVQQQVHRLLQSYFADLLNAIEFHSESFAHGSFNELLSLVRSTFEQHYAWVGEPWEDVLSALSGAARDVSVTLHNSKVDRAISEGDPWEMPRSVIAVGGDVLSRGLTLSGLTVSYFYRKAAAADTLMQMARWFGYRDGYHDLCRLWIDPVVAADFMHVDSSIRELRAELRVMHALNLTPRDFGIAVRDHPDALLITARNKMKATSTETKTVSLVGRSLESVKLSSDLSSQQANIDLLDTLVAETGVGILDENANRHLGVVGAGVVGEFVEKFQTHGSEISLSSSLAAHVRAQSDPAMRQWDVVVMSGKGAEIEIGQASLKMTRRKVVTDDTGLLRVSDKGRIASNLDVARTLLTPDQRHQFALANPDVDPSRVPESRYFGLLRRPAIMIYPIEPTFPSTPGPSVLAPLVSYKLVFPGDSTKGNHSANSVRYVLNTVAIKAQVFLQELILTDDDDSIGVDDEV
ncbi:Z1 domain-containing protein [Serinibacter arcticus]|uniref:Endonuclease n=1 Tax=Serinibacter arcticus TaxID=1655435 RepID=A0A4Z1E3M1_9MICO|nr:Z1 domain-containing protein [Serinibacter arcticus]TGO05362.1 Endonuclease [Serinibacter arcticus]